MYKSEIARIPVDVKAIWVENLRSGKFEQAKGALERIKPTLDYLHSGLVEDATLVGNCCLGVLCRVAINDLRYTVKTRSLGSTVAFNNDTMYVPTNLAKELGVHNAQLSPVFSLYDESEFREDFYLTGLNDAGFTFEQIADVIDYFL